MVGLGMKQNSSLSGRLRIKKSMAGEPQHSGAGGMETEMRRPPCGSECPGVGESAMGQPITACRGAVPTSVSPSPRPA